MLKLFVKKLPVLPAAVFALLIALVTPAAQAYDGNYAYRSGYTAVQIPAEIIFLENADAVVMLETFDSDGKSIRTGSGFIISDTGLVVTNLHVIANAARAEITLFNKTVYAVRGVHAMSEEYNIVIISIDSDENNLKHLTLANSDLVETGNSVYTIGSPLGLVNSMSTGIISNTKREVAGETLIQFTAPISFGSGGSPLFNTAGLVVGITSSSFSYGQNLNLAVPINRVKELEPGECIPLDTLLQRSKGDIGNDG